MNSLTKSFFLLLAFAFLGPSIASAGPVNADAAPKVRKVKQIKKVDDRKKALKQNNKKLKAFGKTEEGKLLKKRIEKTKLVKKIRTDKLRKTNKVEKLRAKGKGKIMKLGKKLDKATKIKLSKEKSPTN